MRTIVDYDGFLSNPAWTATPRRKRLGLDVLLTYLVRPGTACYIGYTRALTDELAGVGGVGDGGPELELSGQRVFAKFSRQVRF